jgi:hypothetical protein
LIGCKSRSSHGAAARQQSHICKLWQTNDANGKDTSGQHRY